MYGLEHIWSGFMFTGEQNTGGAANQGKSHPSEEQREACFLDQLI